MRYYLPLFLFLNFSIFSCSPVDDNLLIGDWKTVALLEEGDTLGVDIQEITLSFSEKIYQYTSTLNYRESGTYHVNETYLFTQDTLQQTATEKAVEIQKLTADSLHLRMLEDGKERLLKLRKK